MVCGAELCSASVPVTGELRSAPVGEWRTMTTPLGCFAAAPGFDPKAIRIPFSLETAGRLGLSVSDVRVASATVPQDRCGAP
jgi:beta-glucosidase